MYLYARLHNRDTLLAAWRAVRQKGSAGGIDGLTIQAFEEKFDANMQALQDELAAHRIPPPARTGPASEGGGPGGVRPDG